jgi:RNA recognition motif-containing protein
MTEDDLRALFEASGGVVSVRVVVDREPQGPKGFGFVEFDAPYAADAAIAELSGRMIDGRELIVNEARPCRVTRCGLSLIAPLVQLVSHRGGC